MFDKTKVEDKMSKHGFAICRYPATEWEFTAEDMINLLKDFMDNHSEFLQSNNLNVIFESSKQENHK
jgi:hypothetical protein